MPPSYSLGQALPGVASRSVTEADTSARPPGVEEQPVSLEMLLAELAERFRRLAPQGTHAWNFSAAFRHLERTGAALSAAGSPEAEAAVGAERSRAAVVLDRARSRLRPLLEAPGPGAEDGRWREVADALDATLEALRFLAARIDRLEQAELRRRRPVDGLEWLVTPYPLGGWAGALGEWLAEVAPGGPVVHGECGPGDLALALRARLTAPRVVEGIEPRADLAWAATERGLRVHPSAVADHLGALPPGALGALVLSGVVDRLAPAGLLELLALATDRLAPAGALVVVGGDPDHPARATPPGAVRDLLPGTGVHAETWLLLLERAGYRDLRALGPVPEGAAGATYAVGGRRP